MDPELARSLRDYTRAAGGGLIIGLPLLYTMEVWFAGFIRGRVTTRLIGYRVP